MSENKKSSLDKYISDCIDQAIVEEKTNPKRYTEKEVFASVDEIISRWGNN